MTLSPLPCPLQSPQLSLPSKVILSFPLNCSPSFPLSLQPEDPEYVTGNEIIITCIT